MKKSIVFISFLILGALLLIRPTGLQPESAFRQETLRQSFAPVGVGQNQTDGDLGEGSTYTYEAISPVLVNLADIPAGVYDPNNLYDRWQRGEADLDENEYRVSPAEVARLQAEAMKLTPNSAIQIAQSGPGYSAPVLGISFDSMDTSECCGGGAVVPPDPHMAAGPNHLIAVVNLALEISDKSGNSLLGPTTFSSFFSSNPSCTNLFDPNALYDEEADRWIIGVDGNGTHFCIAVSQTANPTGSWNIYAVPANLMGAFHDYPHTGVGQDAIFMGANQFGGSVPGGFEGRVWAFDKAAMYAGSAMTPITFSTGFEGTPQPLHFHGFLQGTWPAGNDHYFVTDPYDGSTLNVWRWSNALGGGAPTIAATFDLNTATGVTGGFPVNFPQLGGNIIQANDWRMRGMEYRNGSAWVTDSISCNPGGGTVDCVRWTQIDITTNPPTLVQAGVYASTGEYRTFPDLAVNLCDDMAIGYTKSSTTTFPSIWYSGRESIDPPGTLQGEALLKDGEIVYTAFDSAPHRWGDYTGMTIDPDGVTFWYLGQYSKNIPGAARWGNYIGSFSYPGCSTAVNASITLSKTVGSDPDVCAATDEITVSAGTDVTYCYEVTNDGDVSLTLHDLADSELGTILNSFPYVLTPGASVFLTSTTTIMVDTTNTATWTAYNLPYAYDDNATYNFIDISGTGTALNLSDDGEANVTMPFQFTYFGTTSDLVRVGNNGGMLFATTTGDVGFTNAALPNAAHPLAIFPFWDDLDDETGNVYYETVGSAPNRMFIVQWHERPHFPGPGAGNVTFQAILYEGTNEILFQYADVDFGDPAFNNGASATVGLNKDAVDAVQYSFDQPVLSDGMAILWTSTVPASASASASATVYVLVPVIAVAPADITVNQPESAMVDYTLTISNTGSGDLNWMIDEAPPLVQPDALPVGSGVGALDVFDPSNHEVNQQAGAPAPLSDWRMPEALLYDNGPLVTHPGGGAGGADASVLQTNLGMNTFGFGHAVTSGFRIADDFSIPAGGWYVENITFFGYQTGSSTTSTFTAVNLRIWDGPPGDPGSSVVFGDTTTNRMISSDWANMYRVTDTDMGGSTRPVMANVVEVNTFLPAGSYWLDWQSNGTLASGPWAPPVSILGQTATGNALQYDPGSSSWNPALDSGSGTQQDFPFIIEGAITACASPADVPWLSVNPTSGTTGAGNSSDVAVTIDTTGLTAGDTYTATLCVTSNDPMTPLVEVPVEVTVIPAVYGVELSADMAATGDVGTLVDYTVTITNTGNVADTFDLAAAGVWTATLSDATVTLDAGASTTFTVSVAVPGGANEGDMDVTTVTATSQSDASATDATMLTTTATVPTKYIYLPLVRKP